MSKAPFLLAAFLPCYAGLFYWATNQAAEIPKTVPFAPVLSISTNPVQTSPHILTNGLVLRPDGNPAPGVYSAKPYSMLVLGPGPTKERMIQRPASSNTFSGRIIEPPLRFEPVTRK